MRQLPLQPQAQSQAQSQAGTAIIFRVLVVCAAIVFLFVAALHTGAFTETQLIPAMIVEGLCGIGFVVAAYALLTRQPWAWRSAIVVYLSSCAGVLLGIGALARSPGLRTPTNVALHAMMIALLVIGLSLLAMPSTRQALRSDHA